MSEGRVNGNVVLRGIGLVLVLLVPLAAAAIPAQTSDAPTALYFLDWSQMRDMYNVTSHPPDADSEGKRLQLISTGTQAEFVWQSGVPTVWNVSTGAPSHAYVHLSGLDEVAPIPPPDPEQAIALAGHIEIRVRLVDFSLAPIMEGAVLFRPQPLEPRDQVFAFDIPLEADKERTITEESGRNLLGIYLIVTGRNMTGTNISPVHVHIGSPDTPSRVELEGFPYAAYRAWEDHEAAERRQSEEILRGGRGGTEDGEGRDGPRAIPVAHPLALAALIGILWRLRLNTGRT